MSNTARAVNLARRRPAAGRHRRGDRRLLERRRRPARPRPAARDVPRSPGFGVTVGFHRHAHPPRVPDVASRSSTCSPPPGSMAVQGPVINWVADHRKHHAHTDEEGDPHSPHVGRGAGIARRAARPAARPRRLARLRPRPRRARALRARPLRGRAACAASTARSSASSALGLALPFAAGCAASPGALAGALDRAALGRPRAHLPPAPRHVVDQLDLPLLRPPPLRRRGPLHERLVARAAELRRGLAPQPPRVPALGAARPVEGRASLDPSAWLIAAWSARARLGRRADHARAPARRSSRRKPERATEEAGAAHRARGGRVRPGETRTV